MWNLEAEDRGNSTESTPSKEASSGGNHQVNVDSPQNFLLSFSNFQFL